MAAALWLVAVVLSFGNICVLTAEWPLVSSLLGSLRDAQRELFRLFLKPSVSVPPGQLVTEANFLETSCQVKLSFDPGHLLPNGTLWGGSRDCS